MFNVLEGYDIAGLEHNSPEYLHLLIEAKKAAFSNRDYYITDPEFEKVPVAEILSKEYARKDQREIDRNKAKPPPLLSLSYTRKFRNRLCDRRR